MTWERGNYPDDSPIYSREDAEKRNDRNGFYFFERATLRFFHSRISESFYLCEARKASYFVTSEQNKTFTTRPLPRLYTVRRIAWQGGDVDTVGEFQAYRTSAAAQRAAKAYAEGTRREPTKEDGDADKVHAKVQEHLSGN